MYKFDLTRHVLSPFEKNEFLKNDKVLILYSNVECQDFEKGSSIKGRLVSLLGILTTPVSLLKNLADAIHVMALSIIVLADTLFNHKAPSEALGEGIPVIVDAGLAVILAPVACLARTARCVAGIFHPGAIYA